MSISLPLDAGAREISYRQLTVNDGLAQSHVESIVQDKDGYIWLGTADGLSRFDGYQVKTYRHVTGDSTSLRGTQINCLHVDSKNRLWIGSTRGLERYDPTTDSFVYRSTGVPVSSSYPESAVSALAEDRNGFIWAGAEDGLYRVDPFSGGVDRFPLRIGENSGISDIFEDSRGRLWVAVGGYRPLGMAADGIYLFEKTSGSFVPFRLRSPKPNAESTIRVGVSSIVEDSLGQVWIGTWGAGLFTLDEDQTAFLRHMLSEQHNLDHVRRIHSRKGDRIWVITFDTDSWYDPKGRTNLFVLPVASKGLQSLCSPAKSNPIHCVYEGRDAVVWLGTTGTGAYFGDTAAGYFELFRHDPLDPNSLSGDFVRSIYADPGGTIWVGFPEGLDRIDRQAGSRRSYLFEPNADQPFPVRRIQSICRDSEGHLWIASLGDGVSRLLEDGSGFHTYRHDPADSTSLSSDATTVLLGDGVGSLWVGTVDGGLNRLRGDRSRFDRYMSGEDGSWRRINTLYVDYSETLWIGTDGGLARYDAVSDTVICLRSQPGHSLQFPARVAVNSIAEMPELPGVLWVGTGGKGLIRFDVNEGRLDCIDATSHPLPHDLVYGIIPDDDGSLWLSTMRGLAWFNPTSSRMKIFGLQRGLQSLEFNRNAYHKGPDGEIFFGGVNGLNSFFPDRMVDNPFPPSVVLSRITVRDRSRTGENAQTMISISPSVIGKTAMLSSSQRDLGFEYVGLHFSIPESNGYRYRLDGYDDSWQEAGSRRTASYTNLEPGSYTFRVAAASADGIWSETDATWSFAIGKPFWQTWRFRILAVLAMGGVIWTWYFRKLSAQQRRQIAMQEEIDHRTHELKETLALVESQKERLGEINNTKSNFVANISHELRTPLSLVLGPLEEMREGVFGRVSEEALHELNVALRSTRRMQRLVERLLLVARLEAGELKLSVSQGDFAALLREIHAGFHSVAERQGVDLRLELPTNPVILLFDVDRMEEIVTNLLSNAMKYTSSGGVVRLRLNENPDRGFAVLQVQDTGAGIPASQLAHVFDRFFQFEGIVDAENPGVGIGLSLTKELVELHGGRVTVRSEVGSGSCFTVEIPTGRDHFDPEQIDTGPDGEHGTHHIIQAAVDDLEEVAGPRDNDDLDSVDQPTVLIVDDNSDMRSLIKRQFVPQYRVLEAGDGAEGVALARKALPDVIVSDIMMPEMDGNQLCRAVKADPRLEFIPVVLLTARAEVADKITGLEGGADDYIVKPFNVRELRARIGNLIQLRHRLKAFVEERAGGVLLGSGQSDMDPADAGFLKRVSETVQKNLNDEDFGVEELAAKLRMSRVHLYRRLKGICDRSPAELIMETRLERGARFLAEGAGSVSEVAYGVGFKSLSHFSRRFSKKYGISPSVFHARHVEKTS